MLSKRFVGAAMAAIVGMGAVQAVSAQVVISQVFGVPTGGTGGSTYSYEVDYIELFNRGSTPVDMTGMSVQAEWLGDWEVIPLVGTLQPGQFYLVQVYERQPGTTNTGAPLPTPDLVAQASGGGNNPDSTWLSGSQGAVALMLTTTQIPADSCPTSDPNTLDLVSWGSTILTCGTGPTNAPSQSNFLSLFRKGGGCIDTDSSQADFELKTPNPRNSGMVFPFYASVNAVPTAPSGTTKLTASISPFVCGATATLVSATADLTPVNGSASATLVDNGTSGDVTLGDGTFSLDYALPGAVTTGQYTIAITLTDSLSNVRVVNALLNVAIEGDACQTARIIIFPQSDSYTTTNYTDDNLIVPCRSVTSPTVSRYGVWYFLPAGATDRTVRVTKTSTLFNFSLYTGSCGALTLVDCDDSNSQANWRLAAGVNYYMLSMYDNTGTPSVNPTLVFTEITPPSNDTCSGAIDLASQPNPFTDTTFPFQTSTADADNTCDATPLVTRRGVWYTYLPGVDTILKTQQTVSGLTVTSSVWTGSCPLGLSQVLCTLPTSQTGPTSYYLPAGQRYYILLGINSSAQPGTSNTTWSNTFTLQTPPINDLCSNATNVGSLSSPFNDSVVLSNASADTTVCGAATFGVWYTFTAPSAGLLRLNEGSTVDVSWAVVSGCSSGTQLLCTTTDTDQYVSMTTGQQVWILLYSSSTSTTAATPDFSFIPPAVNDVCSGAVDVSSASFPHTETADARASEMHDIAIPCAPQTDTDYGVWYRYTASASGIFTVRETGAANADIVLFNVGNAGNPCGTIGSAVGCFEDSNDAGAFPVQAGQTYLVLIGNGQTTTPTRPTAAYVTEFNFQQALANDTCAGAENLTGLIPSGITPLALPDVNSFLAQDELDTSCNPATAPALRNGVWYSYVPATNETLTVWDGNQRSLNVTIYTTCGGAEQACATNSSTFTLTGGTQYYILYGLNLVDPSSATGVYAPRFLRTQALDNDLCTGAYNISASPYQHAIDVSFAGADTPSPACNTSGATDMEHAVWYRIQTSTAGTLSGGIEPDGDGSGSGIAALYESTDGTCAGINPTAIFCGTDPSTPITTPIVFNVGLNANTTYFLQVGWPGLNASTSSFDDVMFIDLSYDGVIAGGVCCRGATCATGISQNACAGNGLAGAFFVTSASVCNATGNTTTPCCYADYNKTGGTTVGDIFDFLNDWFAGSLYANVGGNGTSGTLSVANIFDFLNAWFAGC